MSPRTRIKICGITRPEDALAAARAGADAIGLVFVGRSPRALTLPDAVAIRRVVPPFVTVVALFVDPLTDEVESVLDAVSPDLLQFHGEEGPAFCEGFATPYVKAVRVRPETDLLQFATRYAGSQGLLLDAYSPTAHGGTGERFDWSLIPPDLGKPVILAGGLDPGNVGSAVRQVRPWAVDVSSGVESTKGIKDAARMAAFIKEVNNADA
jgi:phosphoribosylanthranilate isomerase